MSASRLLQGLFRIRTRLLVVHAILVILPLAGLSLARTYERELLRAEEEGLAALASALAGVAGTGDAEALPPALAIAAQAGARRLGAQVRVLDLAGRARLDTGAERVVLLTRGRRLLPSSRTAPAERVAGDPPPSGGVFLARPEVGVALGGGHGRATRVVAGLRGVRLYVAEPVRGPDGAVRGVAYVSRSTYPVLVSLYRVRNFLVQLAAGSLALAAAVAVFLALTISRPLRKLTLATRRLAAGERGVALRLGGRDEIGDLARDFDAMARALDARLDYISELAANVSHEFKTPIAAIQGAAELLREGAADEPAARARFLQNILDDTGRLSRLVTRLLELSRIEARREPPVPLDYRALLEDLVARYRAGGHAVSLRYEARYAHLRGHAEPLEAALANLLDNALRASPPGVPVEVAVTQEDDGALRTEVADRGRGISPANLPRVWDRFFTTGRAEGGTGLGLAIVRAVAEQHGGEVGVASAEGEGSRFWMVLPRRL